MNNGIPTATLYSERFRDLSTTYFCPRNTPLYIILENTLEEKQSVIQVKYVINVNGLMYNLLVE
jgi:hypothetical protein